MSETSENTNDTAADATASGSPVDKAKQVAAGAKDKATEVARKATPAVKDTVGKVSAKASDTAKKVTPVVKDTVGKVSAKAKGGNKPGEPTD